MTDNEKLDLILMKLENLDKLENDMAEMKNDMAVLKNDMVETKNDLAVLKNDMVETKNDLVVLKNDVTEIKLTLENEIRVNIQRIAEGHLDLSRKLNEALKIDDEKEMLSVRMNIAETELRRLKERVEHIA